MKFLVLSTTALITKFSSISFCNLRLICCYFVHQFYLHTNNCSRFFQFWISGKKINVKVLRIITNNEKLRNLKSKSIM